MRVFLLDGYVDEPSCLGVPPYLAPQVRYIYGALLAGGLKADQITYRTADQWRSHPDAALDSMLSADLTVIYAGTTVPGHYLSGKPLSITEISRISAAVTAGMVMLGGPLLQSVTDKVKERYALDRHVDIFCGELAAATVYQYLTGTVTADYAAAVRNWAVRGAELTVHHPNFPYVMCELETYRGCPRPVNCDFCSERFKSVKYTRPPEDIIEEVRALGDLGNRYFRLGCQTNILSYGAAYGCEPNNLWLGRLYNGIRGAVPELRVLHMDNINPATIAKFPEAARRTLRIITEYNTEGDTAAFGLESADPAVIAANHIDCTPESVLRAVRIMNEVGGRRVNGIPKLLPGLNFLHGLKGEGPQTMDLNFRYLKRVVEEGLLLRRINIRQVIETGEYRSGKVNKYRLQKYKDRVNEEINLPLLRKVFPFGTSLREVIAEKQDGKLTWGRQLGTYPILAGVIGHHPVGQPLDVRVVDHGYRSLTALPEHLPVNLLPAEHLAAIPGIGRRTASAIVLKRPLDSWEALEPLLPRSRTAKLLKEFADFRRNQ